MKRTGENKCISFSFFSACGGNYWGKKALTKNLIWPKEHINYNFVVVYFFFVTLRGKITGKWLSFLKDDSRTQNRRSHGAYSLMQGCYIPPEITQIWAGVAFLVAEGETQIKLSVFCAWVDMGREGRGGAKDARWWEDESIVDRETRQRVTVLGWAAEYHGTGGW